MRLLAAALLALTTVVVGFAHRPPGVESRGYPADVAAWVLPDGTLPDLCHADDLGDRSHGPDDATARCDACRLVDAPGLGAVAELVLDRPRTGSLVPSGRGEPALRGSLLPAPLSRGPPRIG